MDPSQLTEITAVAKDAAIAGGRELLRWRGKFKTREKGAADFVTDADLASQEAIQRIVAERFPSHLFVGEESDGGALDAAQRDTESFCWVVDPLDGTTNYVHDFPSYAVSIAVAQAGKPIAASIYDPLRDELYWAQKGAGAWLGDGRLETGSAATLGEGLVAISLPPSNVGDSKDFRDLFQIGPQCRAVRRIGSAALNLAYVAAGRLDAYWARDIYPWDVAAGVLLVTEAGGVATSIDGNEFYVWRPACIACCGDAIYRQLFAELSAE
ncbi:MAG: inositol monophosphatase family protein [Planctomycetota bacterium]